ncbi:Plexin domain-containing protein 2 [Lamellibrachia satsuma]|nr:Plexin domain-containing protein 2 [Lamellibrachia satsuma]
MASCVCDVACAFFVLSSAFFVDVIVITATDVSPSYTPLSGDAPMFDIHLATAAEAEEYSVRIRRGVISNDGKNTSEFETTTSSSYRETVALTKQPPLRASTAGSDSSRSSSNMTTTMSDSKTVTTKSDDFATTTSAGVSATTMKTTIITEKNHTYYKSRIVTGPEARNYFVSYKDMENDSRVTHEKLSSSHQTAFSMPISFTFPFYGHELNKVTVATGGFLYMSDFHHRWLTATQYIAPLMANFDTSLRNESLIHYADNGTALIVLWENLLLQDDEEAGPFTFEVILHEDGTIIFSYYQLPMSISSIVQFKHPVKVGLSDAFYVDSDHMNGRPTHRTIYCYHQLKIDTSEITNHTAVIITPLPSCNIYKTCSECLTTSLASNLNCIWCPAVDRCSSSMDRKRQEWLENSCHLVNLTVDQCPSNTSTATKTDHHSSTTPHTTTLTPLPNSSTTPHTTTLTPLPNSSTTPHTTTLTPPPHSLSTLPSGSPHTNTSANSTPSAMAADRSRTSTRTGVILAILLLLCLVCGLASWLVYAYLNPQSKSGLWLIKHRPSQLKRQLGRVRFRRERQSALGEKYSVLIPK